MSLFSSLSLKGKHILGEIKKKSGFFDKKEMNKDCLFQSTAAYRNITIFNLMKKRSTNSKDMMDFDLHRKGHSELEEN